MHTCFQMIKLIVECFVQDDSYSANVIYLASTVASQASVVVMKSSSLFIKYTYLRGVVSLNESSLQKFCVVP